MKGFKLFGLLLFGMMAAMVASCGGDDDDDVVTGDLTTPKYEAVSALYKVTEKDAFIPFLYPEHAGAPSNRRMVSVEFTSSGNYILTYERTGYTRAAESRSDISGLFTQPLAKTRGYTYYDNIIYGTYTLDGDTYDLQGFGTIVIVGDGSNFVTLEITMSGGRKWSIGAQKEKQYSSSTMNNMLCRTWNINKFGIYAKRAGQVALDETYKSYRDFLYGLYKLNGSTSVSIEIEELADGAPKQTVFTKSGSYVVFYADNTLAISTWKWENESAGKARYSWNYEYIDDPYSSGMFTAEYKDGMLILSEPLSGDFDGDSYLIYYLTEAK